MNVEERKAINRMFETMRETLDNANESDEWKLGYRECMQYFKVKIREI